MPPKAIMVVAVRVKRNFLRGGKRKDSYSTGKIWLYCIMFGEVAFFFQRVHCSNQNLKGFFYNGE